MRIKSSENLLININLLQKDRTPEMSYCGVDDFDVFVLENVADI